MADYRDTGTEDGERECSRGQWCARAVRVQQPDGTWGRAPARTPRAFCEADEAIIGDCVRAMPATYARLAPHLRVKVTGEQLLRIPFGPSVPIRLDVDEISRLIVDAVMTWHERVRAVAGLPAESTAVWRAMSLGPRPGRLLAHACQVLAERVPALLGLAQEAMVRPSASPAARLAYGAQVEAVAGDTTLAVAGGAQAGLEFTRLDYLARAAMGETAPQPVRLLGVVCANERCSERALRLADPPQHEGDTAYYSQCMSCRHLMTEEEYRLWAERNWRWWRSRLSPAQIAGRGGLAVRDAERLIAATRESRAAAVAAG